MNYAIFNVFHSRLYEEQYTGDERSYFYAKVGDAPIEIKSTTIHEQVVYAKDLSGFVNKGKHWAESEFLFALYHTMKENPEYLKDAKYIGATQYDHTIVCRNRKETLAHYMNTQSETITENTVLSLATFDLSWEVFSNAIAMDSNDPQRQRGNPSCYVTMIKDYNDYYKTSYGFQDFFRLSNNLISLCSSFVMTRENFMEMMAFSTWAASRNDLDKFDPERQYRAAGGFMERYYGVWIALSGKKLIRFDIDKLDVIAS